MRDAFAAAVAADGTGLPWSTYLGGAAEDRATGVAVDGSGAAYVAGFTYSPDFRMTSGAYRTGYAAGEGFVAKLAAVSGVVFGMNAGGPAIFTDRLWSTDTYFSGGGSYAQNVAVS